MTYFEILEISAHWAAILTAVVAVVAACKYGLERRARRRKLELYLRSEKERGDDKGQRTLLHLTARLAMTESDILHAAFSSRHIRSRVATDSETQRANTLFLEAC